MTMVGIVSLKGWKRIVLPIGGIVAIVLYIHITIESARVQQANDQRAQQSDKRLEDANRQLKNTKNQLDTTNNKLDDTNNKLDEVLQIVKRNNPELEGLESVDSIIAALKNIESRTTTLEKETQKTVFIGGDRSMKQLPDGTFEIKFNLIPIGENIIPLIEIGCKTTNGAKILDFNVSSKNTNLSGYWSPYTSPDKSISHVKIKSLIEPGILNVFVLTDIKTDLDCEWIPALR